MEVIKSCFIIGVLKPLWITLLFASNFGEHLRKWLSDVSFRKREAISSGVGYRYFALRTDTVNILMLTISVFANFRLRFFLTM